MSIALLGGIAVISDNIATGFYVTHQTDDTLLFPALILICMLGMSAAFHIAYVSNA